MGVWLRPHVRSSFPLTPCRPCTSSAWPWPEEKRKREHLRKSEHHGYARHSTAKLCGIFREICQALSAQPGCQAAQRVHRGLIEALDAVLRAEPFQFLQNPSTWSLYKPLQKNPKLRQTAPPEQLSFRGMKHTVHVQKPSPLGPCRLRESGVLWSLWNLTIPSRRSMLSRSNAKRYRTLQFCEESQVSGPEAPRSLTPDRGTPPRPGPEASARQGRAPAEPASPVGAYAFFRQRGFGSLQ